MRTLEFDDRQYHAPSAYGTEHMGKHVEIFPLMIRNTNKLRANSTIIRATTGAAVDRCHGRLL